MATKYVKKRNWAFILYPDSMPPNWYDFLVETGLPFAVSPLHDRDVIESTGEQKKPHYHCIICYDGPVTFQNVSSLIAPLHGPIPQPLESVKGAYRYLTHQDNPEKAQYSASDVRLGNGFDISSFAELTRLELENQLSIIFEFIRSRGIFEYCDLIDQLGSDPDLRTSWSVACNHTILFNNYLHSRRHKSTSPVLTNPVNMELVNEISK